MTMPASRRPVRKGPKILERNLSSQIRASHDAGKPIPPGSPHQAPATNPDGAIPANDAYAVPLEAPRPAHSLGKDVTPVSGKTPSRPAGVYLDTDTELDSDLKRILSILSKTPAPDPADPGAKPRRPAQVKPSRSAEIRAPSGESPFAYRSTNSRSSTYMPDAPSTHVIINSTAAPDFVWDHTRKPAPSAGARQVTLPTDNPRSTPAHAPDPSPAPAPALAGPRFMPPPPTPLKSSRQPQRSPSELYPPVDQREEDRIRRKLYRASRKRERSTRPQISLTNFLIATALCANAITLLATTGLPIDDYLGKLGLPPVHPDSSSQSTELALSPTSSVCEADPNADGCFTGNIIRQGTVICGHSVHPLALEFANSPVRARIGLSHRFHMAPSTGFVTVFETPSRINFITRDLKVPIDLISFNRDGNFEALKLDIPPAQQLPVTIAPATGLLALKGGEITRLGITPDCRLHLFEDGVPAEMFEGEN